MDRVTTLRSVEQATNWIDASVSRFDQRQREVATGVRFNVASELPADAAVLLRSQRSLERQQQLARNHSNTRVWLDTADTALNNVVESLTHGRTRAIHGANSINNVEARQALADDLRAVAGDLRSIANTTINGRPIFAGTSGAAVAYDDTGAYVGDNGQVVRTVTPNESFVVAGPGPNVFGTVNATDPLNGTAFQMLNAVADAVEAGDVAGARQGVEAIDAAIGRVQTEIGRIGSLANRLDEIEQRNEASQIATRSQISDLRDVEIGEAIVRLRAAEAGYEATLSAAAKGLGRSLLDFLR